MHDYPVARSLQPYVHATSDGDHVRVYLLTTWTVVDTLIGAHDRRPRAWGRAVDAVVDIDAGRSVQELWKSTCDGDGDVAGLRRRRQSCRRQCRSPKSEGAEMASCVRPEWKGDSGIVEDREQEFYGADVGVIVCVVHWITLSGPGPLT
jgi:hypothetical protein